MPDLLTHALAAYVLGTLLSWRYDWLTSAWVTVAMAGAFVPDLVKIGLLVHESVVVAAIGRPFSWAPLHYLGGVVLSVLVGVLVVAPGGRRRARVLGLLALGAGSHLFLDMLLRTASGRAFMVLWPLTTWRPPTPGLYLSTEPWPTLFFGALALGVWYVDRQRGQRAAAGAETTPVDD